jgi:cob(I)alamin adenosyltransferase
MKGLIHVYTGDGKGKTTAALGLALRAAGCGKRIVIVQFFKGRDSGELRSLESIPNVTVLRLEKDYGFYKAMSETAKRPYAGGMTRCSPRRLSWLWRARVIC